MIRRPIPIAFQAMVLATALIVTAWAGTVFADDRPDLVVAVNKLPRGLEPHDQTGNVDVRVTYTIFDTLIRRDFTREDQYGANPLIPSLATSWKRTNPTTLELQLRKGVKFHNGAEFTADDVLWTFDEKRHRGKDSIIPKGHEYFGHLAGVEKINDYAVRFTTNEPDAVLEQRLATYGSWIVSKKAWFDVKAKVEKENTGKPADQQQDWMKAALKAQIWNPVGTGPYKFDSWKKNQFIKIVAHDSYFLGKPTAKTITYKEVPELAGRIAGLVSGEFQIIVDVTPDQIGVLEGYKDIDVRSVVLENSNVFLFNTVHPQLKDKRLRQALSLAIDRKKLVDSLWRGLNYTPNGHQIPAYGEMFLKDRKGYLYDPAKARKLVAESGYDGKEISLRLIPDYYQNGLEAAQIAQEMWRQVGINVKLEMVESFKAVRDKKVPPAMYIWSNSYRLPDPAGSIIILWGPDSAGQKSYKYWQAPKVFNDAANVVLTSADMAERRKAFEIMLDSIEDDMPMTILYNPLASYGVSKKVEWMPYPLFYMDFRPDILKFKK